jgi:hypothetical protein
LPYATANGGWCSLPVDLLHQVYGRLTSERDVLHFRQVCTHWRASGSVPVAPFRPWVVARRAKPISVGPMGEYSLWLPRGPRRIQVAGPHDLPFCYGTPLGWLALADDELFPSRLVLWEPGSGTEIQLPTLALVIQVFLSSSGWMAVATQVKNVAHHNIFFWRPGDAAWSAVAELATCDRLHSVAFLGGKMYCLDYTMKFAIYDLNLGTASPPVLNYIGPLLCLLPNPRSRRKVRTCPAAQDVRPPGPPKSGGPHFFEDLCL